MNRRTFSSPLFIIFFTVFVDVIGVGILIPVIPQLLASAQSPYYLLPSGWSLSQGYILLGILSGLYPLMQFVATPILGQLSDRFGRKPILAFSLFGTCLSYIIFAIGIILKNIPLLFFSRALDGITGGNISVAQAAIADVTTPEHRAKNFGLIGAAFGMGFILGPFIGGKLSDPHVVSWFSATTPFWFAAILSFINVLFVQFLFPETLKITRRLHITWDRSIQNIIKAWSLTSVRPLFITTFLLQGGFSFFTTFFSVYLIRRFHFSQGNIGDFFAYIGLWIAFTQAVLTRKAATKFEEYQILRVTLCSISIGVLLFYFPTVWWWLLFITPIFAISNGLTQSNLLGLLSRSVDGSIQGEILGINASVQAIATAIPPMLSGIVAATFAPESSIFIASGIMFCAWIFFVTQYVPKKA